MSGLQLNRANSYAAVRGERELYLFDYQLPVAQTGTKFSRIFNEKARAKFLVFTRSTVGTIDRVGDEKEIEERRRKEGRKEGRKASSGIGRGVDRFKLEGRNQVLSKQGAFGIRGKWIMRSFWIL